MPTIDIFMVARKDGNGYRKVTRSQFDRMPNLRFEGVDGNEQENTITYWYDRGSLDV